LRVHANAPLGPKGRLTIVCRVLDEQWSVAGPLHIENYQRYKRSGAEQLGHDEQGETETGGRRFAVTVVGLGFGFHLVSVQEVVATLGVTRVA
jgi:hypothetical protein